MPPSPGVRPDLATRLRQRKRALARRLGQPETQVSLMRAAHGTLEPAEIGELVVARAVEWLKAAHCGVVAEDHDGHVQSIAARGLSPRLRSAAVEVARWVVRNGREFVTADLRRDPRVSAPCGAVVALPLRGRERVVGALVVLDRSPSARLPTLGPDATSLLVSVLDATGVALDNAMRLRRAEELSVTDDLTQLWNSRYLNQVLRREVKRAVRSGQKLSLLFADLDGFKAVNDAHGHQAGSATLVEAAGVMRGSARETDVVARFGGDEFAIVLPETGSEGAVAVAERVRDRISRHTFRADDGLAVRLTISIGVATLPDVAASADELMKAADTAMYRVKGAGKNGVFAMRGEDAAQ